MAKTQKCSVKGCKWRGNYQNFMKHYSNNHAKKKKAAKVNKNARWKKPKVFKGK